VLYKSESRNSVFVYPIVQQLSDKGTNKKRLEEIRLKLNWAIFKDGPTKREQCGNKNFLITSDVNRITTTATTRASYLATGKFPPNCLLCFHDIDDNQLSIVLKDSTQRNEVAYFFSEMFKLKVNDTNIPNIRGVIGGGEWTDINNIEESVEASLYEELYYSEGREGSASDPARSGDQKKSNEEGSLVSGLSGNLAPGDTADDDTVAMLTKRLEESQMQIEELRDQASRSITVAEAAIVSAEAPGKDGKTPEKDWVETITYQAAEAAAKAQRRQLIRFLNHHSRQPTRTRTRSPSTTVASVHAYSTRSEIWARILRSS